MRIKDIINSMTREDFELLEKRREEVMSMANHNIAETFSDPTNLLLNQIKLTILDEKTDLFKKSFEEVGELSKSSTVMTYDSADQYTLNYIKAFYIKDYGYPQGHFNKQEFLTTDFLRDIKGEFCRISRKFPEKSFLEKDSNILKENIEFFIKNMDNFGLPKFFNTTYICALVQYCIIKGTYPIFDERGGEITSK